MKKSTIFIVLGLYAVSIIFYTQQLNAMGEKIKPEAVKIETAAPIPPAPEVMPAAKIEEPKVIEAVSPVQESVATATSTIEEPEVIEVISPVQESVATATSTQVPATVTTVNVEVVNPASQSTGNLIVQ